MSISVSASIKPTRSAQELRRGIFSVIGWVLCGIALVCVIGPLVDIVGQIGYYGLSAFSLKLFTTSTNGTAGGLANAIEGTFVISIGAMAIEPPRLLAFSAILRKSCTMPVTVPVNVGFAVP